MKARIRRKHNIVYKITNTLNNYIYIGCHATDNINDGYMGSGKRIKEHIKICGRLNFIKEVLFDFPTMEEMFAKEKEIVTDEFRNRHDTYNLAIGGDGWGMLGLKHSMESRLKMSHIPTEDTRRKMSMSRKGRPKSDSHKEKIRRANTGKVFTPERCEKISNALKGRIGHPVSDETKKKISSANTGKKRTEDHCKRNRERQIGKKIGPQTAEHKEKRRLAQIGKKRTEEQNKANSERLKAYHAKKRQLKIDEGK